MLTVARGPERSAPTRRCAFISVRPERHSHAIISRTGEFVINSRRAVWRAPRTGAGCARAGLRQIPRDGPDGRAVGKGRRTLIAESPVNIECRVRQVLPLGTHDMFLAEVVGVRGRRGLHRSGDRAVLPRTGRSDRLLPRRVFRAGRGVGSFRLVGAQKEKGAEETLIFPIRSVSGS